MRQVMLASVRLYARRYVATAVAVLVGVGFVVTTGVLSAALRDGILADARSEFVGAGTVVSDVPTARAAERLVSRLPGDATANLSTAQRVSAGSRILAEDADVASISVVEPVRWQRLESGRFPARPGEAAADAIAAEQNEVSLGDEITLGEGETARTVTITGLVESSTGPLSAPVYLTFPDMLAFGDQTSALNVVTTSEDVDAVRALVPEGITTQSATDYLEELQTELTRGVNLIAFLLLTFAAVAFFVAGLVIANTFAVLLAQRTREFALLRCVGATRRQVRRSVLAEALVVGSVSATVGVLAGIGAGAGLGAIGKAVVPVLPLGDATASPVWFVGAWLLGVVVTVVASLVPASRGTRISPVAPLRPDAGVDLGSPAGRRRIGFGVLTVVLGVLLLALAVLSHHPVPMLAGGAVSFVGVLMLGPVLVPACVRLLGLVAGRFGVPGRLAAANALRNPRRTAATAASLLVGVTLVSALTVGMSTVRVTVGDELDGEYPLDASLVSAVEPLPASALARVRAVPGVQAAARLQGVAAKLDGVRMPLLAAGRDADRLLRGKPEFAHVRPGEAYLPWETLESSGLEDGDRVRVEAGGEPTTLRVHGTLGAGAGLVSPATLDRIAGGAATTLAVWVRAADDADASEVASALNAIGWSVDGTVQSALEFRANVDTQLDVFAGAVIAMLGVGFAIALVGVGNTLGLSVLERARESAVLRALGLTRRQLRVNLAIEALLLATVAGVLGVAIGVGYAWVGVLTVGGGVLDSVQLTLPVGQLALLLAGTTLAGLLACVLPARRAAQIAPAQGVTAD